MALGSGPFERLGKTGPRSVGLSHGLQGQGAQGQGLDSDPPTSRGLSTRQQALEGVLGCARTAPRQLDPRQRQVFKLAQVFRRRARSVRVGPARGSASLALRQPNARLDGSAQRAQARNVVALRNLKPAFEGLFCLLAVPASQLDE